MLILARVQLKDSGSNASAEAFGRATPIMNLVAVAQFFKAICTGIFKCLLAAESTNGRLLRPVLTYFGMVETNSRGMLHLHYLVWLREAFYLAELRSRLLSNLQYTVDIVNFIDTIICCSMADIWVPKDTH